jgi:hypothetical protein
LLDELALDPVGADNSGCGLLRVGCVPVGR